MGQNKLSKKVIEAKIRQKQEALQREVFEWAKSEGIASAADQVPLTLKFVARPLRFSTVLDDKDWSNILARRFKWTPDEKVVFDALRNGGTLRRRSYDPVVVRIQGRMSVFKSRYRVRMKRDENDRGYAILSIAKRLN